MTWEPIGQADGVEIAVEPAGRGVGAASDVDRLPVRCPRERAAESFRATIATVDADGDGQISRVEAGDRWERLGKYDTDGDGHVTEAELLAAYDRKQARAKEPSGEPPKE